MKHTQMLRRYRHAMRTLRWQKLQRFRASHDYAYITKWTKARRILQRYGFDPACLFL